MERQVLEMTRRIGIGAQFGGKYFCHDVRVIRLPRHGASLPIGIGVSCSADRQILAKITPEGVFLEQLETDPARFLPEATDSALLGGEVVKLDLNRPMIEIRRELSRHPVATRLALSGTVVVARDIAHAKAGRTAGEGRAFARLHQGPSGVLRQARPKRPDGICHRLLWPNHRRADGLLCRAVPGGGRQHGDARQG